MDEGEEEEEEEEELDHANIIAHYGGFNDVAMGGDNEEEVAAVRDAQRECESDKEKAKFERMLEDHRKSLYPTAEEGQKKAGYHTGIAAMEGKEWYI